jgi:hypothetical protein
VLTFLLVLNAAIVVALFGLFAALVVESLEQHRYRGLLSGTAATVLLLAVFVGNVVAAIEINR